MVKSITQFDPLDNTDKNEDLISEKQKLLIDRIIGELFKEDDNLYYAATNDVANLVEQRIKKRINLNQNELELVGELSSQDIAILMSYHSNCC